MLRWSKNIDLGDATVARIREQDDEFCRVLRVAIERGKEFCSVGVRTEPCTDRPIMNYQRPDSYY
jgi:hypothetical protein